MHVFMPIRTLAIGLQAAWILGCRLIHATPTRGRLRAAPTPTRGRPSGLGPRPGAVVVMGWLSVQLSIQVSQPAQMRAQGLAVVPVVEQLIGVREPPAMHGQQLHLHQAT